MPLVKSSEPDELLILEQVLFGLRHISQAVSGERRPK